MKRHNMPDIGLVIAVVALLFVITVLISAIHSSIQKKRDFMEYCIKKGNDPDDCRWEYERIKSGQSSKTIILPMTR